MAVSQAAAVVPRADSGTRLSTLCFLCDLLFDSDSLLPGSVQIGARFPRKIEFRTTNRFIQRAADRLENRNR
jgi:hypothetical protein